MELNRDESVKKTNQWGLKLMVEKSGDKTVKSSKFWKLEETSDEKDSDGDTDDGKMTFINKRFQHLSNKNMRLSERRFGFRGTSSRVNRADQKGCFNC